MKIFVTLAIALTVLSTPLSGKIIKPFVIGGEDAAKNEIPFLVEIWWSTWGSPAFGCSGVILSENMILTTARCVHDIHFLEPLRPRDIHVVAGDPDGKRDENLDLLLPVKRIIIHPDWAQLSDSNENDLAILELTNALELTSGKIEIATLAQYSDSVNTGDYGIVTGWGNINEDGSDTDRRYTEILQKITLAVSSNDTCLDKFGRDLITPIEHFCAGSAFASVCHGDQGSPFIISDGTRPPTVYGLVSNVKDCSSDSIGALFIKLGPHLEWIYNEADIPIPTGVEPTPTTPQPTSSESPGEVIQMLRLLLQQVEELRSEVRECACSNVKKPFHY